MAAMNRSLLARVVGSPSRVVSLLSFCAALTACIEANRPQFVVADSSETVTGVDTTTAGADVADVADAPDVGDECDGLRQCPRLSQCVENACVAGRCVAQNRQDDVACDDNEPCTTTDVCRSGVCMAGPKSIDNTVCDDDGLFCTGFGLCVAGTCERQLREDCPTAVSGPCSDGSVCSEEAHGACVPKPLDDGEKCDSGKLKGECSRGACVPPAMVWVPEGVFDQGCDGNVSSICQDNAKPEHDVYLSGFAIGAREVAEGDWRKCVLAGACLARVHEADHALVGERVSATELDWVRAKAVCEWSGAALCSEAQWEKAARGTGDNRFPWGNAVADCTLANFADEPGATGCGTHAVDEGGARPAGASPYGALDMAGNVWEWVADGYLENYSAFAGGTPRDPTVPVEANDLQIHMLRGGGWQSGTSEIYVYHRRAEGAEVSDVDIGARCCWQPEPSTTSGGQP